MSDDTENTTGPSNPYKGMPEPEPTIVRTVFNTPNTYVPPAAGTVFDGSGTIIVVDHGDWELYSRPDLSESINGRPPIVPLGTIFCRRISDGVDWYEFSRDPKNLPVGSVICTCLPTDKGFLVQGVFVNKMVVFPGVQRLIEIREYKGSIDLIHKVFEKLCYDPIAGTIGEFGINQSDLLDYASKQKAAIEQGGITVNGMPVATDRASQAMIT